MRKLYTELSWPEARPKIDYNSKLVLLGSCFAESIGARFEYYKFNNQVNPFGIIFHPRPLLTLLQRLAESNEFTGSDVFEFQGRWLSFSAHSSLSKNDKKSLVDELNVSLGLLRSAVSEASHIFITLGTAYGYRHRASDSIVANCHKVEAAEFDKELSSITELSDTLKNSVRIIRGLNSKATVVFTVSPVRHLKDGMVENNRSKSHLISAAHELVQSTDNLAYFPAYEILMDELRDYRFYKDDMIHPSDTAIDRIWEVFSNTWVDPGTVYLQQKIGQIRRDMAHRPFNPESEGHQKFLRRLEEAMAEVKAILPGITFD